MSNIIVRRPWTRQPQGVISVDFSHPIFAGATKAVVFSGHKNVVFASSGEKQLIAVSGTFVRSIKPNGIYAVCATSASISIASAISTLTTILYIGNFRTIHSSGNYYCYDLCRPNYIRFGNGAGAASSNRRDYSWSAPEGAAVCLRPSASILSPPSVYVNGYAAPASNAGGTCLEYNWGGSSTPYSLGDDFVESTGLALFVAVDWAPPDSVCRESSANPWRVFSSRRILVPYAAVAAAPTVTALTPTIIGATSHRPRFTYTA